MRKFKINFNIIDFKYFKFFFIFFLTLCSCNSNRSIISEIVFAQKSSQENNYDSSISTYEEILKKNPPQAIKEKILFKLGTLYAMKTSHPEKAIYYLEKLRGDTEDLGWIVKSEEKIGEIRFEIMKDYKNAYENFQRLCNFKPKLEKNDFYEFKASLSLLEDGKLRESLDKFNEISANIDHQYFIASFYYKGLINLLLLDNKESLRNFEQYIQIEKDNKKIISAKFITATIYENIGEFQKSYEVYLSILDDYPARNIVISRLRSLQNRRVITFNSKI